MPKGKQTFRRTDGMRAIKVVTDAGLGVSMVRFRPGEIEVVVDRSSATSTEPANEAAHPNSFDQVLDES
jgi:hypothetical protein